MVQEINDWMNQHRLALLLETQTIRRRIDERNRRNDALRKRLLGYVYAEAKPRNDARMEGAPTQGTTRRTVCNLRNAR